MAGYPLAQLNREVAVLSVHFHWPLGEILALPHRERQRWVRELAQLREVSP